MVKANGYGHGAAACAAAALAGGATRLAVAAAARPRSCGCSFPDAPILMMGALTADELDVALARRRRGRGLARGLPRALLAGARRELGPAGPGPRQARQRHGPARRARPRTR